VNFNFQKGGFMKNPITHFFFLSLFIFSLNNAAYAQWSNDPTVNMAICTAANYQSSPFLISDGEGGAIITWDDCRSGSYNIYAQRVSASGVMLWATNGVGICTAANDRGICNIISDGEGGAIIAWTDYRGGTYADIYAQRINANGAVLWIANGVAISNAVKNQIATGIVSDGAGGAIIAWHDYRSENFDIYSQRINASGIVQWTTDGVAICTAAQKQENPTIASDGAGGAIITWMDYRSGSYDIYAQRINVNGIVQWTDNGLAICNETNSQTYPKIISSTGDAIITWMDVRTGDIDIYAQRINLSGMVLWTTNGVAISSAPGWQQYPTSLSDGAGGAIIAWSDYRSSQYDLYAQRINVSGEVLWTTNGVAISATTNAQMLASIASDGAGGAIIAWEDQRSDYRDTYAQRINANGGVLWTDNGVAVSTATNDQFPPTIVSDGSGDAIITWHDNRNGYHTDIYAQNINSNGQLGDVTDIQDNPFPCPESFCLEQNYPNPFYSKTEISWNIVNPGHGELKILDFTGREVITLANAYFTVGKHKVNFYTNDLPAGVYFYQIRLNGLVETRKMSHLK
jgi:hypothetical protein